jgi:acyl-CoA synthetase (AMP-forming)/AMP-acid ligase II
MPGADSRFSDGWFYPGDVGSLSPDGVLSIAGRADNVVNFGGVKTTLEFVETELSRAPAVKDLAAVATIGGQGVKRVVAFVVAAGGWSEEAFLQYCRAHVDKAFWPAKLVMLTGLPLLPNGKIDRQRLATLIPS